MCQKCNSGEDFFRGRCYECFSILDWRFFCSDCNKSYKYQPEKCSCGNTYFLTGHYTGIKDDKD